MSTLWAMKRTLKFRCRQGFPEALPEHMEIPEAATDECVQSDAEAEPVENTPLVMFTFGPQRVPDGGWRVSFSF